MKLTFDVPEELAEKIGEEIKAALDEYKKKQVWPQNHDTYYYISACGEINSTSFIATAFDKGCLSYGNCFKTREEAEFKREQLKVLHELEQLADDDQPWDGAAIHWYPLCSYHNDIWHVKIIDSQQIKGDRIYFKSKESAQNAIDQIGKDRLKKYYFCMSEE